MVGLEKKTLHFYFVFNEMFLPCRVPTFRGQKVAKQGGHRGVSFLLLIELGPICNSMTASLLFNSLEDHILLKRCNGGLWKTFTGLGPIG